MPLEFRGILMSHIFTIEWKIENGLNLMIVTESVVDTCDWWLCKAQGKNVGSGESPCQAALMSPCGSSQLESAVVRQTGHLLHINCY